MRTIFFFLTALLWTALPLKALESFGGAYAGGQMGLSYAKIDRTINAAASSGITKNVDGAGNFLGSGFVGYGLVSDALYMGAELRASLMMGETKTSTSSSTTISNIPQGSYVAAGRLGLLLTPKAMIFLSLGAGMENLTYKISQDTNAFEKKVKNFILVPGTGAEISLTESLNVRMDLNYSITKKNTFNSSDLAKANINMQEASFKATRLSGMVGISYRF